MSCMNELELETKKYMHNRIFHAYVYSTMLSIYYANIAHDAHTIHNIIYMYIYCSSDESFMWGSLRLVPINLLHCHRCNYSTAMVTCVV